MAAAALVEAGAVALDGLIARLGPRPRRRPAPPCHFGIVDGAEVLAPAELSTVLWDTGESAAAAIGRAVASPGLPRLLPADAARRRVAKLAAARRPTLRGAVELSALLERGDGPAPGSASGAALRRHAELERRFAGPGPLSAAAGSAAAGAGREWTRARLRAVRREAATRLRPRQLRVAFCGIDGAGKSTQVALLVANLQRVGIRAQASWTRIGNGASAPVEALARIAQRLLPSGAHSFQATRAAAGRATASGPDPQEALPGVAPPRTRRGLLGWGWALAVTLDYLARSRAAARRASGAVLVLDRALPDALVELQDDYGVALRLTLQRRLLTWFTPQPQITCYLRLPGAVAKARKDDMFTAAELDLQILAYEQELAALEGVIALDAQRPPGELALEALRAVASRG